MLGFTPTVLTSGPVDTAVPAEVRDQLLPVLREAVSNVARHAHAEQAQVEVQVSATELRLSVSDDGVGLGGGPDARAACATYAAARPQLGGSVELRSNETSGTTLVWRVPDPGGEHREPDTHKRTGHPSDDRSSCVATATAERGSARPPRCWTTR